MSNVVSMESKLEELERKLAQAENHQKNCLYILEESIDRLEVANKNLALAIAALERML